MTIRSALVTVFALAALTHAPSASAQTDPLFQATGPIGLSDGLYARLSVYYTQTEGGGQDLPPGPCRVTLRFVDVGGRTLTESVVDLAPSRATMVDYRPEGLATGERATVRAYVVAAPDARGHAPLLSTTVEVVDAASGRTLAVDSGAPASANGPRAAFGILGLANQQVARLNAACLGVVTNPELPPGPCRVTLSVVSGDGKVLTSRDAVIPAGESTSVDFAAGALPAGIRRRVWAKATPADAGSVTASVEVFDQATGRTTVLLPGQLVQSWGWE